MRELHVKSYLSFGRQIEPPHHWHTIANVAEGNVQFGKEVIFKEEEGKEIDI